MEVITVQNLHKVFTLWHTGAGSLKGILTNLKPQKREKIEALKGISFSVKSGETLAIIGRNGSGKSTLLGLLLRIYRPDSGSVTVKGRSSSLLDLGAGLHPDLTGIENIFLNGSIFGLTRKQITKSLNAIIAFAELEHCIDSPLRTYSNGMVMRLGFSIAVHADPDILFVDEVLAVGDEVFQKKCYDKIREFQQIGKTIVFVSHDLKAVRDVATRVLWLNKGEIKADGEVNAVLDAYLAAG